MGNGLSGPYNGLRGTKLTVRSIFNIAKFTFIVAGILALLVVLFGPGGQLARLL